jgi:hypothetical protein
MRRIITLALTGCLMWAVAGAASAAKPVTVFQDATGDAGNQDSGVPGADQGGFDLVSGTITKAGSNLEFQVTSAAMPQTGALPEGFRLLWHINVDGEEYRFTVKSADIGKPDAIAQEGTDRIGQVDTDGVFRLEQCSENPTPAITLVNCKVIAMLDGAFDATAKTITWSLPMKTVKAKTGSLISGGTTASASSACQICWVPHYAERSLTPYTIIDSASMTATYKVPKK